MNAHNPRDKIDQRKTDALMDRRKGEDRRQVYDADYFEDGVPDDRDKCPNTPKGATVNADGCWAYQGEIFFDVNSSTVKSEAYPMIDEAVKVLRNNPDLNVEIQGHTDNTGTAKYNLWLSQKRAESAMNYLVDKGIDPGRLTAKGYGFEQPVASNDTPEGRAKNRRVEFRVPQ